MMNPFVGEGINFPVHFDPHHLIIVIGIIIGIGSCICFMSSIEGEYCVSNPHKEAQKKRKSNVATIFAIIGSSLH